MRFTVSTINKFVLINIQKEGTTQASENYSSLLGYKLIYTVKVNVRISLTSFVETVNKLWFIIEISQKTSNLIISQTKKYSINSEQFNNFNNETRTTQ